MSFMNGRDKPSTAEDLFAHFLALRESGEEVPFDRFVRDNAEFETELVRLAEGWDRFEDVFDDALKQASSTAFFRRGRPAERMAAREHMESVGLAPGARIGEYRLLRMLAEGGMGQVWEARQQSLDRRVALKFIRPDNSDPDALFLFEREARAGGRLSHPCAVAVYATGVSDGVSWIAQELVEGGYTLDDFLIDLRRANELPPRYFEEVARFFLDVAEVLQAAHDAGVIHRDVKPSNVLISPDDRPKLTDFGLARLLDDKRRSDPLSLRGTPHYMSPEQISAKAVGPRAEMFSLGAMLFEVLTLRRPFDGETRTDVFGAILRGIEHTPREVDPRVPADLSKICAKALARDAEDRYGSMRELADELRRYLAHEPILARPIGPLRRAAKWVCRNPTVTIVSGLGGALAVALLVMAAMWLAGRGERRANLREQELLKAINSIQEGDFDGAREHAGLAMEADPTSPRPHVVMAGGFARFGRLDEVVRAIDAAKALGFEPGEGEPRTAAEHLERGLYAIGTQRVAGYEEAERHLSRAIELDASLLGAHYPLYQVRRVLGDDEGALAAVRALWGRIGQDEDAYPVMDALRLELEGRLDEAIAELEAFRDAHAGDEALLAGLRVHRNLGRCYLAADRLDEAEAALRRSMEIVGDEPRWIYATWFNLGAVELRRQELDPDATDSMERLDRAIELIRRGREWDASHPASIRLEAEALVRRFGARFDRDDPPAAEDWAEVESALREFGDAAPEHPAFPILAAQIEYLRALVAPPGAPRIERLERCVERNPRHVPALVGLGEELWFEGEFGRGLETFDAALAAWDDLEAPRSRDDLAPAWPRRWLVALHAWRFGTATNLGDLDAARESGEAMERELAAGATDPASALLSYAEFLATAPEPLKDCDRAMELLEEHDLERRVGPQAAGSIAAIEAACP